MKGYTMGNREYIIVTDSSTDMGADYYKENNVRYAGLHYIIDNEEYVQYADGELGVKEFYDRVRAGSMPKTSPVAYDDIYNIFEEAASADKDVFCLCFSAALSDSYRTMASAANDIMEKYPECTVNLVDSAAASGGEGLLLYYCVQKKKDGMSLGALTEFAETLKNNVVHLFTVDDLNHLHRGGRVSKMTAIMGGMLGIKPVMYVSEEGKLTSFSSVRGRRQSLEELAMQMKKKYIQGENDEVFISHADDRADAEYLGELVKKMMPDVKKIRYCNVGAVIGSHAGPNTIALFFIGNDKIPVEE